MMDVWGALQTSDMYDTRIFARKGISLYVYNILLFDASDIEQ